MNYNLRGGGSHDCVPRYTETAGRSRMESKQINQRESLRDEYNSEAQEACKYQYIDY